MASKTSTKMTARSRLKQTRTEASSDEQSLAGLNIQVKNPVVANVVENHKQAKVREKEIEKEQSEGIHRAELTDEDVEKFYNISSLIKELELLTRKQYSIVNDHEEILLELEGSSSNFLKLKGPSQYVWKIENFSSYLKSASTGEKRTLYSPVFKTHHNGYKISASVCPYGEGRQAGKCMSVYFAIVRGQYDAILKWPFKQSVTFTLVDQSDDSGDRRDIIKTFHPKDQVSDNSWIYLGKPTTFRNPSVGIQSFIPLDEVKSERYLKEDVIFIKVQVDLIGI